MAIGFTPKYTETISFNGIPVNAFVTMAARAGAQLGWTLVYMDKNSLLFETGFSWVSWGEEVRMRVMDNSVVIESKCTGSQLVDWGKNKKNITRFLVHFYQVKEQPSTIEELPATLPEDFLETVEEEGLSQGKDHGLLGLLIPAKHYFVTPVIILLNIIAFIAMLVSGVHIIDPGVEMLVKWGANLRELTMNGEWWRLFTSCFIHIGIIHLLFNMVALVYVGVILEPLLGWMRYLLAYILTGLIGSAVSTWWHEATASAGASGAIFGLYGVFLALLTTKAVDKKARQAFLASTVLFIGYNLVMGFKGNVDNAAHIGGLLSGVLIGYIFYPGLKLHRQTKLKYATMLFALVVASVILFSFNRFTPTGGFLQYKERMESFVSNEAVALSSVYDMEPGTSDEERIFAIREHGLVYWKKCQEELYEIDRLDISPQAKKLNSLMKIYCEKRIASYHLMYKALVEGTSKYQPQIETYEKEIEVLLREGRNMGQK